MLYYYLFQGLAAGYSFSFSIFSYVVPDCIIEVGASHVYHANHITREKTYIYALLLCYQICICGNINAITSKFKEVNGCTKHRFERRQKTYLTVC